MTGRVVGSFFAGSVTRVVVRLDDGQMLTIDALGHSSVAAGTAIGVVFQPAHANRRVRRSRHADRAHQ